MRRSLRARVVGVGVRKQAGVRDEHWVRKQHWVRDELFSECHTRGCQMAFLHPAAFPRSRLDTFGFLHLEGSFHGRNAHYVHTALLLIGAEHCFPPQKLCYGHVVSSSAQPGLVPKPELHFEFSRGQRANWSDCGVCIDLIAGSVPGLQ